MPFVDPKDVDRAVEMLCVAALMAKDSQGLAIAWRLNQEEATRAIMGALTTLNPFGPPVVFQGTSFASMSDNSRPRSTGERA